jgi:hypothetical protein
MVWQVVQPSFLPSGGMSVAMAEEVKNNTAAAVVPIKCIFIIFLLEMYLSKLRFRYTRIAVSRLHENRPQISADASWLSTRNDFIDCSGCILPHD